MVDNTTAVATINQMGTFHSNLHIKLVQQIWEWYILLGVWLTVVPIPGKSIPDYVSDRVESIQRRALRIIYPEAESYDQSLRVAKLETSRRISLCTKYMNNIKASESHPLYKLIPRKHNRDVSYHLRGKQDETYLFHNHTACRTNCSQDFFMFKYF